MIIYTETNHKQNDLEESNEQSFNKSNKNIKYVTFLFNLFLIPVDWATYKLYETLYFIDTFD